jgi:glycerophosphoryl diester phosphodiesterase
VQPVPLSILEALSRKPFSIVGHRGARGLAPENTVAALRAAIEAGADVAEFDVQVTVDGVPVASHDPVVVADDGRSVNIRETGFGKLRSIRVRGEPVPAIEELLLEARGRIGIFLDVKEPDDVEPLLRVVRATGSLGQVAVISFSEEAIQRARRLEPSIATGIIYFRPPGKILECKKMGCRIVLPRYPLATPRAVALAHRLGLRVVAWTVNTEEWVRRLVERGVDAIATDYPDRLAEIRRRLQAQA